RRAIETPMATTGDGVATITPNDAFRRVRQIYVGCIVLALPLLFLAFYTLVERIGHGILPAIFTLMGIGLLLVSMFARAAAICPRCAISLIWKRGPIGTGRISLTEKSH